MNSVSLDNLSDCMKMALQIVRDLQRDQTAIQAYMRLLIERIPEECTVLQGSLYRLGHAGAWRDEVAALRHLWGDETGDEALAVVLYGKLRHSDDENAATRCIAQWGEQAELARALFDWVFARTI